MAHQYPTLPRNGFLLPERIKARYEGVAEGKRSASGDALDIGINSLNTPVLRSLRVRSRSAVRNDRVWQQRHRQSRQQPEQYRH